MSFLRLDEANSAPSNALAGFEGPLYSGERKGRRNRMVEENERKDQKGWENTSPKRNDCLEHDI